ncbi:MAG: VCBS repeat-containing protein [Pseudomonadota bacterium]|nr:VCBS repeat-containing protein [Pseudomonadota bacterium]
MADRERAFLVHGGPTARIEHVGALAGLWPATAADLDGNGRAELVGVDDEQVVVYASGPAGWTPRWSAPAPVCRAAVAADFDGDGRSEIALREARRLGDRGVPDGAGAPG